MLSLFRRQGLMSVIYGGIIVAIIAVFIIQFRPNANQKSGSITQSCVAVVKGHCIDPKDYRATYRLLIPRDSQGNLMTGRAKSMGLGKIATDGLIERELLVDEADRIGLTVTDDEVTDEIYHGFIHVSVPAERPDIAASLRVGDGRIFVGNNFKDPKTKEFDIKIYERSIRNLVGRSPTEFREAQARELLAYKMRKIIVAPVRVSEPAALASYINEKSSAEVTYIPVRAGYVARYAVDQNDADIQKWAADKDNAKKVDELVAQRISAAEPKANHVRHILIRVEKDATADEKSEALGKLAAGVARLKRGDAFADVARDLSQDPGSAEQGGDVGDKTDGFVVPFRDAANALKPGEVTSGAVETQFGYHLIEKDDPSKVSQVSDAIKKDAQRELFVKEGTVSVGHDLAAKILASIKAGKSADDAAKDAVASLKGKTLPTVPLSILSPAKSPASVDGGAGGAPPGPSSSRDAGAGAALLDGGASVAEAPIVPKVFTSDNDPDRPQAQTSNDFNRGGDPIPGLDVKDSSKVIDFAFGTAKEGELYPDVLRGEDGFYVFSLKSRKAATKEDFAKDKDTYLQTLLAAKQAEAIGIYVRRLRDAAKDEIKIDNAYVNADSRDGGVDEDEEEDEP